LRVTLISKACILGAYQTKLEQIAGHDDIELSVVVPPYWIENGNRLDLERSHTRGYDLVVSPLAFNGRYHLHFYPRLSSVLRQTQPDICHIDEEPYNMATYLAARAARRGGAKCLFFSWQNIMRRYPLPFAAMERAVYRWASCAIAGNQDALAVLRSKGYDGGAKVIPQFGVDPSLFRPHQSRSGTRPFTIGFAGRFVPEKGLDTLIDAVENLGGEWRLLLIGDGPLRGHIEERLSRGGLDARTTSLSRVPSTDMPRHLGAMDVLVLPSIDQPNWREQFGRILIEAMACETPVIGSQAGEIPNVIGSAGLTFSQGDADQLREQLASLQGDASLRQSLGRLGRERVMAYYTQAHVAEATVAVYRRLSGTD